MGKFSGRTNLYTGKPCVGGSQYRSSTKGRWASETWHAEWDVQKHYTYTHSGTVYKESMTRRFPFPL